MTSFAPKTQPLPQGGTKLNTAETPLLVKELAASLGVSLRFVYQMRACGFPMDGHTRRRQMATLEEARTWIKANNFRLKDSVGVVDPPVPVRVPSVCASSTSPRKKGTILQPLRPRHARVNRKS